nr:hypothetical protein [Tanacetum cinerariifolium]
LTWRLAERYHYDSFTALVAEAHRLPASREGFVIRFANGLRLKIKGAEYRRIHALISHCTPLALWDAWVAGDDLNAIRRELPEEFWSDFDNITTLLQQAMAAFKARIAKAVADVASLDDKELGFRLAEQPEAVRSFLFPWRKSNGNLTGRAQPPGAARVCQCAEQTRLRRATHADARRQGIWHLRPRNDGQAAVVRHLGWVVPKQAQTRKYDAAQRQQRQDSAAHQLVGFAEQACVAAQFHFHPQVALADFAHNLAQVDGQGLEQSQQLGTGVLGFAKDIFGRHGKIFDEQTEVGFEGAHVGNIAAEGQAAKVERHAAGILPGHANKNARKGVFLLLGELAHHAKVNEYQLTIGAHEHVAGVRVGVKKPELEYLGQVDVHAGFGHLLRAEAPGQQLRLIGYLAAGYKLDYQYFAGTQLAVSLR